MFLWTLNRIVGLRFGAMLNDSRRKSLQIQEPHSARSPATRGEACGAETDEVQLPSVTSHISPGGRRVGGCALTGLHYFISFFPFPKPDSLNHRSCTLYAAT